jgi:hypothetical protein
MFLDVIPWIVPGLGAVVLLPIGHAVRRSLVHA